MTDFFISYNKADRQWAEWIAFVLEEEGFSTTFQGWDFRLGTNFVLGMQAAAANAKRTVMVLSSDYLTSAFASSEWAAAFAKDPMGIEGTLLPVMVRPFRPDGLLGPIVWVDIADAMEKEAKELLIAGVKRTRAKPEVRPPFPGARPTPAFPGRSTRANPEPGAPYVPNLKAKPSDADGKRFQRAAFAVIRDTFKEGLKALEGQYQEIEADLELRGETEFTAEIFVDGKRECTCRVWLGGIGRDESICYNEGRPVAENSVNEMFSMVEDGRHLYLSALMGDTYGRRGLLNSKRLSAEAAGDYLWRRFSSRLERAHSCAPHSALINDQTFGHGLEFGLPPRVRWKMGAECEQHGRLCGNARKIRRFIIAHLRVLENTFHPVRTCNTHTPERDKFGLSIADSRPHRLAEVVFVCRKGVL